ncbi:uncharacterized protein BDW70DRAFT_167858 [Aspergillus foveolatus]|uniref:uncharacterized protein n=1 Tax=Aspergillus foveolatus TaxID=210207 RepID=UPI003CCD9401
MPTANGTNDTNGVNGMTHVDGLLENERDRLAVQELVRALHEPKENVYHLVYSPTQAMCVRMGIDLEIFTSLSKSTEPVSLEDLAAAKGASPIITGATDLRILAGIGYVEEQYVRLYKATQMTRQMTDRDSIAVVKSLYDYGMSSVAKVPEFLRKHNYQFPAELVEWCSLPEQLIKTFDDGVENVFMVDVAGGRGHDLKSFTDEFPDVKGQFIFEDLGHVLEQSVDVLGAKKITFDLFKEQPIKGAYAMRPESKLIIEEFILSEKDCPILSAMWDWEMMVFCHSFERSESHWRKVLTTIFPEMDR